MLVMQYVEVRASRSNLEALSYVHFTQRVASSSHELTFKSDVKNGRSLLLQRDKSCDSEFGKKKK